MIDDAAVAFLKTHHAAAMTSLRRNGSTHAVRVATALIDGKIWSSGTQARKRTANLRRDPRSTLFYFDNEWRWLTLECRANILDGPDAPQQNLRLFQIMQQDAPVRPAEGKVLWYGTERTRDEFLRLMSEEQRLIYEFDIVRAYGMYGESPGR